MTIDSSFLNKDLMESIKSLTLGLDINSGSSIELPLEMANRHGVIAGATGSGKTVTMQVLAEGFSRAGVPVITCDVKGDLSGIAAAGELSDGINERVSKIGLEDFAPEPTPTVFWDLEGVVGHPLRATVSEMGPLLFSRLLRLNDVQTSVFEVAFKIADDQELLLVDLKDLRALFTWIDENRKELRSEYGNLAPSTIGAIQRRLITLEGAGGEKFFGEPAVNLSHLMSMDFSGRGVCSVIDAREILSDGRVYTSFMLWLLSELFEQLPEVGDLDRPKVVFFFDEAHLLFKDANDVLLEKIDTVIRLIRSRGVSIFFVTQNPLDIPDSVLSQLQNRVQHVLRAHSPRSRDALRKTVAAFPDSPGLDLEEIVQSVGIGEAVVSCLSEEGTPSPGSHVLICPPRSRIGALEETERREIIGRSPYAATYSEAVDRDSAYETLKRRREELDKKAEEEEAEESSKKQTSRSGYKRQGPVEAFMKSMLRSFGSSAGRRIFRGLLGSLGVGKK